MRAMGGSAASKNTGKEVFVGKGRVFIIYKVAKVRVGDITLALSGFTMLADARNRVKQGIAGGALGTDCWFGLVDEGAVLQGQTCFKWKGRRVENRPASSEDQVPQQCETPESTHDKQGAWNSPPHAPSNPTWLYNKQFTFKWKSVSRDHPGHFLQQ